MDWFNCLACRHSTWTGPITKFVTLIGIIACVALYPLQPFNQSIKLNVNTEISASYFDWQAFDPISISDFRRSISIVGASGVTSKFYRASDTDKRCSEVEGTDSFDSVLPDYVWPRSLIIPELKTLLDTALSVFLLLFAAPNSHFNPLSLSAKA
ncbi:hypothetical protein TNCV_44131 [Trichonephila clavipes]|nr:hypothetical protein TNCV_44131 [Trichonephila clavipes]